MSTAYLDSSIILRILMRESQADEAKLQTFGRLLTSELTEIECSRTLDRIRITEQISDEDISLRARAIVFALPIDSVRLMIPPEVGRRVIDCGLTNHYHRVIYAHK